jgi:hypothetical protein
MTKLKTRAASTKAPVRIPDNQWSLPVTYTPDGSRMMTLKEIEAGNVAMLSLPQMTMDQRAALVARRIEMQPEFEIGMIGVGIVRKDRAIAEVKAQSQVGRILIEIEQLLLNKLMEQIELLQQQNKARAAEQ